MVSCPCSSCSLPPCSSSDFPAPRVIGRPLDEEEVEEKEKAWQVELVQTSGSRSFCDSQVQVGTSRCSNEEQVDAEDGEEEEDELGSFSLQEPCEFRNNQLSDSPSFLQSVEESRKREVASLKRFFSRDTSGIKVEIAAKPTKSAWRCFSRIKKEEEDCFSVELKEKEYPKKLTLQALDLAIRRKVRSISTELKRRKPSSRPVDAEDQLQSLSAPPFSIPSGSVFGLRRMQFLGLSDYHEVHKYLREAAEIIVRILPPLVAQLLERAPPYRKLDHVQNDQIFVVTSHVEWMFLFRFSRLSEKKKETFRVFFLLRILELVGQNKNNFLRLVSREVFVSATSASRERAASNHSMYLADHAGQVAELAAFSFLSQTVFKLGSPKKNYGDILSSNYKLLPTFLRLRKNEAGGHIYPAGGDSGIKREEAEKRAIDILMPADLISLLAKLDFLLQTYEK